MSYIEQLIKDSNYLSDIYEFKDEDLSLTAEQHQNFLNIFENEQLKRFYAGDLNFSKDEIMELIGIMEYIRNKYVDNVYYLAKYYKYSLVFDNEYANMFYDKIKINPENIDNSLMHINRYYLKSIIEIINNLFSKGCLIVIKYLITSGEIYKNYKYNIQDKNSNFFYEICLTGNLDLVKYVISNEDIFGQIHLHKMKIQNKNYNFFGPICSIGNLDLVKYALLNEDIFGKINIHGFNENAFTEACSKGHLNIAKYLISLEYTHGKIDIHTKFFEAPFERACIKGHLYIVKYLISLEKTHGMINIHGRDNADQAYNMSLNYPEISEFLLSLQDTHGPIYIEGDHEEELLDEEEEFLDE